MNASPITKITSWLKFLAKNLHLVGCATVCVKSEVMLMIMDLRMLDAHHKLDCEELKAVLSLNILLCIYPDFDSFFMIKVRKLIIAALMKCSLKNNGSQWKLYNMV